MMASDSRAVRILSDLCCALRKDKNIHEFGFVYCPEPVYNKSPIVFVDGNLGIETWGIKPLYHYAHSQLFESECRQHDLRKLSDFSMVVVLLNPECMSAWNLRKQLVLRKFLKVEDDLNLARLVLTKHPKSPETFCHRRWLLQHLFPSSPLATKADSPRTSHQDGHPEELAERLQDDEEAPCGGNEPRMTSVRAEMEVCTAAASRYPSNYNAWSHRIWVIEHLAGSPPQFLELELKATKSWVSSHVSDHSGFHYRQFLVGTLTGLSSQGSPKRVGKGLNVSLYVRLLLQELQLILDLVTSYPGHEAVWYHRRFVVHLWKALLCNGTLTEPDKIADITAAAANTSKLSQMPILPTESESTRDHPTKNQTKRPIENKSFENGEGEVEACFSGGDASQRKHMCLAADQESTSLVGGASSKGESETIKIKGASEQSASAGKPHSRCTEDASSDPVPSQRGASHPRSVSKTSARASSRKGSCRTDDAFSSHEILKLIQHERRFVEIVVDGTHVGEKEAQQRCAVNYSRWLDKLAAS
ncbi:protein prenyltransferase alpha subunit repeat-containing protein 1-like [Asterias rubens]|uniref:protein prenyltransferase alpha subunit repeat-containing protein 1-like n=1 Tax=Asterias rubens TaxID=7604 RepID=UPI0014554921|nr:protein prenyltransferase alpha subunit repeat-containing protein 1-like [Asterias rubens]